jgi:hypothetical protein
MVDTRPVSLNRKLLGEFLKNPESIRAFENLGLNSTDLADVVTAIENVSVLTLGLSDSFGNERVVTSDGEVQLTDGGAGGNLTFGLSNTGVSAGSYGDASHLVRLSVNEKGRITLAQAYALNSDNVTEGSKLFFTTARARNALTNGAGITYDNITGVITATSAGAAPSFTPYTAPTISNPPTQAEVQALADAVDDMGAALSSLIGLLQANGNLT